MFLQTSWIRIEKEKKWVHARAVFQTGLGPGGGGLRNQQYSTMKGSGIFLFSILVVLEVWRLGKNQVNKMLESLAVCPKEAGSHEQSPQSQHIYQLDGTY